MTCTKQRLTFQNTPDNLHICVLSLRASFRSMQLYHNANVSDVDSFSTHSNGTKAQQQRKAEGWGKNADIGYESRLVVGLGPYKGIHLGTHPWCHMDIQCCGVKVQRAWDLFHDIIILVPITTHHVSQFQLMWLHRSSSSSCFQEWWAAFRSYMGQMFNKTRDQMTIWRWDNPCAFRDRVDSSNPRTTSSREVKCSIE